MYIGDYLGRRSLYTPANIALVDVGENKPGRYSYAELNRRANSLARWFQSNGIQKGDRIGMLAFDGIEFYDVFFACGKIGAIFTPYNWRLAPKEIEAQINLTSPKILFSDDNPQLQETNKHLANTASTLKIVPIRSNKETCFYDILQVDNPGDVTCESITEHDTACLLFTGGTTGEPNAAQISHGQIAWNTFNSILADVQAETFLNIFPMFHTGGLFAFSLPVLIQGGTIIQTRKFDAEQVIDLIQAENVTIFGGVPTVFQMLTTANNWDKADLSSLKYCMSGGAPMPVSLIQEYHEEKNVVFRQGFGMTEFGPGVFSLASDDAICKAGSIGKPNFFVDAKIVNPETNTPLPPNQKGELLLRGPVATTGYFNNLAATRLAFDDENYFHTGDLAYQDEEGYFFIVDRLKDMFTSGGENIYPAEIESVIYQNPKVKMCAVVDKLHPKWGQVGVAFVVTKKDKTIDKIDLQQHLKNNLAKYKIPKYIIFVESLPLSGAGKVLKKRLRELLTKGDKI